MAKTLVVTLTCDRCAAEGKERVEGTESVAFGYDGFGYGLDLCAEHAGEFHNTVQSMISWSSERSKLQAARRARRSAGDGSSDGGAAAPPGKRTTADRERLKAIREWARKNGHPDLGDRGRIPQAIVDEYEAAHA